MRHLKWNSINFKPNIYLVISEWKNGQLYFNEMVVRFRFLSHREAADGWNCGVMWLDDAWTEDPCTVEWETGLEFSYKRINMRSSPGAAVRQTPQLAALVPPLTELTRWIKGKPVFPAWGTGLGSAQRHDVGQLLGASESPKKLEILLSLKLRTQGIPERDLLPS